MEDQHVASHLQRSESIENLAKALASFQSKVPTIKKDADNPFFKSKYASLENIISTIRKKLSGCDLSIAQFPNGKNGLTTILMHKSGEYLQSTVEFTAKDTSPQAVGSAITYMRRYALSAVLGLATDEDDDGNAASATQKKPSTKPERTVFESAVTAIVNATTPDKALSIAERAAESSKLNAEQKQKIQQLATSKVDSFDNHDDTPREETPLKEGPDAIN